MSPRFDVKGYKLDLKTCPIKRTTVPKTGDNHGLQYVECTTIEELVPYLKTNCLNLQVKAFEGWLFFALEIKKIDVYSIVDSPP